MRKNIGGLIGTGLSFVGMGISTEQLEQIISIICSVVGVIIVIITSIIIPLVKWHKQAKADGKISKEEIEDAKKIINSGIDDVKDEINKKEK